MTSPVSRALTTLDRQGDVAILRMTRGKGNAMDTEFLIALREAFDQVARSDARALVLTGAGAIFSAGVDLPKLLQGGRAGLERFLPELSACFCALFEFPRPAIAAINGHAIAGGCILACACDRRLMSRGPGRIGVPELRVGVPFPLVPLEIVRFAVPHVASELALRGRNYAAGEALERGLVDELVEPARLLERALEMANDLASIPTASFARTKRDLRRPTLEALDRLGPAHDRATLEAWSSPEVQAAVRAFVERTLGAKS
jgi:enoyl-CoA hydratase